MEENYFKILKNTPFKIQNDYENETATLNFIT